MDAGLSEREVNTVMVFLSLMNFKQNALLDMRAIYAMKPTISLKN